jgi:hypothetical protein
MGDEEDGNFAEDLKVWKALLAHERGEAKVQIPRRFWDNLKRHVATRIYSRVINLLERQG